MDDIWPMAIWTIRAALLIAFGAVAWRILSHLPRDLKPSEIRRLVIADLPEFTAFSGKLTVFGQELAVYATPRTAEDQELRMLDQRITALEEEVRELSQLP